MKEAKVEKIYDYPLNDSRIPVAYIIVNNESLGGGGFGEVFKVQREPAQGEPPDNQFYALKKIKKEGIINEKDKHYRVLSEIKIHRTLKNKYICKYEHSFEDDQAIYILLEYCERKSIDDFLKIRKAFTEYETRYYMFQVLLGLKYLRRKKIIHRDLTLGNLFLKDYKTVKIGDFGLSYIETENEEKPGLMCGTKGYYTPESIQTKYSYKTDIFCFGVCIYHMMTGLTLFQDSATSFDMIKKNEINYDEKTKFSSECKDLFEQIFVFENKRIDLDEIFVHPFFNEGKGLIDVDFPNYFDEKMNKKDYEEKIRNLEKNVIMTNVSVYPKKNENSQNKKIGEDNNIFNMKENLNNNTRKREVFFKDTLQNVINNNQLKEQDNKNKDLLNLNNKNNLKLNTNDNNNIIKNKEPNLIQNKKEETENKNTEKVLPLLILDELTKKQSESNILEKKPSIKKILSLNDSKIEKDDEEDEKEEEDNYINNNNQNLDDSNNQVFNDVDTLNPKENNEFNENNLDIGNEKKDLSEKIFIKNIIEENSKYGIGYQLNNDDIGVLFNDDSVMTKFDQYKNLIFYRNPINRLQKIILPLKSGNNKDLVNKLYLFGYIIEEQKKNKTRIKHSNIKEEESKNEINFHDKMIGESKKNKINKKDIYLLKYKKRYNSHCFILSNNNIQIKYTDGTDVIFCCTKNKKIIYISHDGNAIEFELGPKKDFCHFICEDPKINKKIKSAIKEIVK